MGTMVNLIEWEAKGLRCPDHKISFVNESGKVHQISLLQMPNGTGKTTTLELLRAALSGTADNNQWDKSKVRSLRKRSNDDGRGIFRVALLLNDQRVTFTLNFNFEEGSLRYSTTTASGIKDGFRPPRELKKFLHPDFVNFFVFDGELAAQLLSRDYTDAQRAIENLFQLGLFSSIANQVHTYWDRQTAGRSATEDRGMSRRRNRVSYLRQRIHSLKREQSQLKKQYEATEQQLQEKKNRFNASLSQQEELRERLRSATNDYTLAKSEVQNTAQHVLVNIRSPQALSAAFAHEMILLKVSFDRVKLPESTAREFFEELAEESHCVCGQELTDDTRAVIRERASQYLGSDDVALLNSIKSDIGDMVGTIAEEHEKALRANIKKLIDNCQHENEMRTVRDEIQNEGVANDPTLEQARDEIEQQGQQQASLKKRLDKYEDINDTAADENTYGIQVLERRFNDADKKLAEITHTLELRDKRDLLTKLLEQAQIKSRSGISEEICEDANRRIIELMPNNAIRIEEINRCLVLSGQEGGSVGETLSVAYSFLSTLFNRSEHQLPFIVDSPANPIDLRVRSKVAELIPHLTGQFIAFIISSERQGFLAHLEQAAPDQIQYLTLFRKGAIDLENSARKESKVQETHDGFCVTGRTFFHSFHLDTEVGNV